MKYRVERDFPNGEVTLEADGFHVTDTRTLNFYRKDDSRGLDVTVAVVFDATVVTEVPE